MFEGQRISTDSTLPTLLMVDASVYDRMLQAHERAVAAHAAMLTRWPTTTAAPDSVVIVNSGPGFE